MSKLTKFDPATCRIVLDRIKAALAPLAAELGVEISTGGGKYEGDYFAPKLRLSIVGADGAVGSPEANAFRQLASLYGLKPDDLGKSFKSHGRKFTIAGLKTRAHARPVVAKGDDGKLYGFPVEAVKIALLSA